MRLLVVEDDRALRDVLRRTLMLAGYDVRLTQGGVFHPNENTGHETGESAQREAQETAGKFPTAP